MPKNQTSPNTFGEKLRLNSTKSAKAYGTDGKVRLCKIVFIMGQYG